MTEHDDTLEWLENLPKAELHLHIDGTLEASRMLSLAKKNRIDLPYKTIEDVQAAYNFTNLQSFLDLYYQGASVLRDDEDFYHLMMDYLQHCRRESVLHTEIMVEPQTYIPNGISMAAMMRGFQQAIADAREQWGQSALLILSFLRHLSEDEALATLAAAEPYREEFVAIGLASSERGHPPEKFETLYQRAHDMGFHAVAHAGEEGPPDYIWNALRRLNTERIDHGVRCTEDEALMDFLRDNQIPLTVCPLSNVRLCVFDRMEDHTILTLLDRGLRITVNSDDPAYFGGYLNENFHALYRHLGMTRKQARQMAENSFHASFLPASDTQALIQRVKNY